MSAQIKEAKAAAKAIDDYLPHADFLPGPPRTELETIRSAIKAALQEAEALKTLHAEFERQMESYASAALTFASAGAPDYAAAASNKARSETWALAAIALTNAAPWLRAELELSAPAPVVISGCAYHVIDVRGCSTCDRKNGRK